MLHKYRRLTLDMSHSRTDLPLGVSGICSFLHLPPFPVPIPPPWFPSNGNWFSGLEYVYLVELVPDDIQGKESIFVSAGVVILQTFLTETVQAV